MMAVRRADNPALCYLVISINETFMPEYSVC